MKAKYEETIEIIPKLDGTLVVCLKWRDKSWQEDLPRNIQMRSEKTFKDYLRRGPIPRLRLQLLEAQKAALKAGDAAPEECVPILEVTEAEAARMAAAQAKRQRKAGKLQLVH